MWGLDEPHRQAVVRGRPVELTTTEWRLLTALAAAPRRVFSRYELINRTRGYEFDGYEPTVDSHVRNLRQKIEADPHQPAIVQTVVGAGYRFALRRDRPGGLAADRSRPGAEQGGAVDRGAATAADPHLRGHDQRAGLRDLRSVSLPAQRTSLDGESDEQEGAWSR